MPAHRPCIRASTTALTSFTTTSTSCRFRTAPSRRRHSLTTIHGFSSERILPVYKRYNTSTHYVSISDADRHPALDYLATVHHGIDLSEFTFRPEPDDYLLFFGRIHPDKGAAEAIEVAKRSGRPLVLAGIVQDKGYFERKVAPHLNEQIRFVGSVGPAERNRLLGGAYALLHLINFDEPFGLSMVEAMACGTPVIATGRGSVPEVIMDEMSGFVVANLDEATEAVARVPELSREKVYTYVKGHFDVQHMVAGDILKCTGCYFLDLEAPP